ncbi:MAG: TIM barrel protein [Candidatus Pacearchaeota archaeon]
MASYEYFYPGKHYDLDYDSLGAPSGYQEKISNLGITIDPRTANQLKEVQDKLNTGLKQIEVQGLMPNVFEAIPEQHLKEINRSAKLTNAKLSLHGPLVEASGFDERKGWSEENRAHAERQISQALERGHTLDPDGNIVVTFHSTSQLPEMSSKEKTDGKEQDVSMYVIDSRTGDVKMIKKEEHYFPKSKDANGYIFEPKKELEEYNKKYWSQAVNNFAYSSERGLRDFEDVQRQKKQMEQEIEELKAEKKELPQEVKEKIEHRMDRDENLANIFLQDSYNQLKMLYDIAYKSAKEKNDTDALNKLNSFKQEVISNYDSLAQNNTESLNKIVSKGIDVLQKIEDVEIYKPFQEFVLDESSKTFANAALNSYKKFKDKAPIISIENPPAGMGLSRADDIKKLIEKSREELSKKLQNQGRSASEANAIAEKMIGATWDVGHINMIRRFGYSEQDVIKEAEKIKPYLKHVHLSDNFGFEHTELPMGMGNVPMKKIMEALGKKGEQAKKIIETGDWYQHFKTSPVQETLNAFGASTYDRIGAQTWTQISSNYGGNYFSGYGIMLPEKHFETYGGGFSNLPSELGGQVQRKGSKFSGTPNE